MPSISSRLFNILVRATVPFAYRPPLDILKQRARMDKAGAKFGPPKNSAIAISDIETPVAGRWLMNPRADRTLLYLHGGAFVFRLPAMHTPFVMRICERGGYQAFMPWYRLAPENPFPAAPQDCLGAYRYLLEAGHKSDQIVLMGDSAGGNLVLALLHLIKREGLPMPSALSA